MGILGSCTPTFIYHTLILCLQFIQSRLLVFWCTLCILSCTSMPEQNPADPKQTLHIFNCTITQPLGVTAVAQHRWVIQVGENLRSHLIQPWAQGSQHWIQTSLLWALTSWMLEASKGWQFTASWGPVPKLNYPLQVVLKATCKNFQNLKTATETIITAKRTANCSWRELCHYTDANMKSHFLLL